jgi:tetratricopeptide (TPR) repeat protein
MLARPTLALALCIAAQAQAQSGNACGDLANAYGPHDYQTERGQPLRLVERGHFPASVEALAHGKHGKNTPVGPDLEYTLRAFPNHHRALLAAQRFSERAKKDPPPGMRLPVECWFDRAVRFRPNDVIVRMLYSQYMASKGQREGALAHLEHAQRFAGDNPFTHYNLGLLYLEMKEFDRALAQAHRAIELGFERDDLKAKLVAAGRWSDTPPSTPPAGDAAPAATPSPVPGEAGTGAAGKDKG